MKLVVSLACAIGFLAAACASAPMERARSLPPDAAERQARAPASYVPPPEAVPAFASDAESRAAVEEGAREGGAGATHDVALDCVAAVHVDIRIAEQVFPAPWLQRWIAWRCGVTQDVSSSLSWNSGSGAEAAALGNLRRKATNAARRGVFRYGVARQAPGTRHYACIVTAHPSIDLEPVPKRVEPGATIAVTGRPAPGISNVRLSADEPDQRVREIDADAGPTEGTLRFRWTAPAVPGRYFLELSGKRGESHPTLAWFPIHVGVPEPTQPDDPTSTLTIPPADPATALRGLFDADRGARRLPELKNDPTLSRIVQQRSADRAADQSILPFRSVLAAEGLDDLGWHASAIVAARAADVFAIALAHPRTRKFLRDPSTEGAGIAFTPVQRQDEDHVPEMHFVWVLARARKASGPPAL